jgi:uncharacterized protein YodC (DUF2158 family)
MTVTEVRGDGQVACTWFDAREVGSRYEAFWSEELSRKRWWQ